MLGSLMFANASMLEAGVFFRFYPLLLLCSLYMVGQHARAPPFNAVVAGSFIGLVARP